MATGLTDLAIGTLLFALVAAAIWFILIPGMKDAGIALHSAVPSCQDIAKNKREAEKALFVRRCESQRSAAYVTSFMSM
jgi:hypothetical protein